MIRVVGLVVLIIVVCLPASASEPGQPLDCDDWVFLEPGYSCSVWWNEASGVEFVGGWAAENAVLDNEGRVVAVHRETIVANPCSAFLYKLSIVWSDGSERRVIGYIEDRCNPDLSKDMIGPYVPFCSGAECTSLRFDSVYGQLLLPVNTTGAGHSILAIEGFATTFDILHTYTPSTNEISLRVPYMPEGFQYADYFDTYWGDLATVGDWSQAQPLQCGYPATAPVVGDYLTVEDTLPSPAPGHGYYYVTAVNYQGQRRYGRQSNGGVLTGRDPTVLPAPLE